jgi:putative ABC transport system permease protein
VRVLAFCAAASILTGLLFGIAPALHASRVDLAGSMRGARGGSSDRGSVRLRHALVVVEVAIACLLLAGTGLLGRSFLAVQRVEVARDPDHLITTWLIAPDNRFGSADEAREYYRRVVDRAAAIPGVEAAALTSALPLEGWSDGMPFSIAGRPDGRGGAGFKRVSPEYFATIGLPVLRGRSLTARDRRGTPPAIVINEALRAEYFADRDPVGERLLIQEIVPGQRSLGPPIPWEIVGVAANEHVHGLADQPSAGVYAPIEQSPSYGLALVLRAPGGPSAVVPALRAAVKDIDPHQPLGEVRTLGEIAAAFVAPDRLRTALLTAFAAIALLLAAVGVYGVVSYSVAERTREIGIRAALGASRLTILTQVLSRVCALTLAGVVLGLAATLALGRFLASLLVGVSARDVPTLAGDAAMLCAEVGLPAWVPARRAASVDPVTALRL